MDREDDELVVAVQELSVIRQSAWTRCTLTALKTPAVTVTGVQALNIPES